MNYRYPELTKASRIAVVIAMAVTINLLSISDATAQRGRGGGGARMGGGGGGGYRPQAQSYSRSPSMSRPAMPSQSRPAARPSTGAVGNRPAAAGGNRTGVAGGNRAGVAGGNRAGVAGESRSAATGRAAQGASPSRGELNSFLNVSGQGAGARASGGNAAVNDFFNHNSASATHNAATTHDAGSVANQRAENIAGRTDTRSNVRDSRGENREFASDNRQDRVSNRGDNQAARVTNRGETRSTLAAGRGENRSQRQQQRSEHADSIRDELENEFDQNHLFDDFWKNNPEAYYRFNQNPAFWTWATVGAVGTFMGAGYSESGGGGDVYYDQGTVYSGEQQVPAEEYAAQAEQIVDSAPEVQEPDEMEWLPLGVFALAKEDNSDAAPNMFLQLAVSKEGIIAGNYNNKSTDETKSVEGMVDPKSGRAAWTIAGKSTPIMEAKLGSLTENETDALVHFADGTTQQWLMLHLEKPKDNK